MDKKHKNRQFGIFENVASLGREPSITFVQKITKYLLLLKDEIKHYFFNDVDAQACTYTRNPFTAKPDDLPVGTGEQEELIDLQCDEGAQEKFKDFTLANFRLSVSSSHPTLAKMQLLSFSYIQQHGNANKGFLLFLQSSRKL